MRAVTFAEFGPPDVLRTSEVDPPHPRAGEVLMNVTYAGINSLDAQLRRGETPLAVTFPFIAGMEPVGTVAELGDGVTDWQVGDRVLRDMVNSCGRCRHCRSGREWRCPRAGLSLQTLGAGFAEQLVCDARRLVPVPDGVTDEVAAAVQITYGAAWHTMVVRANVRPGETVLVNSVCGGVGTAAADVARQAGAFVIGTASTAGRAARALELGCHAAIDYSTEDVASRVRELTHGDGVDVAFDHVGGKAAQIALDALATDGRLVVCGWHGGGQVELDLVGTIVGRKTLMGSTGRTRDDLERCLELVARGALTPVLDATYDLDDAGAAFSSLEGRRAVGKIVLRVAG